MNHRRFVRPRPWRAKLEIFLPSDSARGRRSARCGRSDILQRINSLHPRKLAIPSQFAVRMIFKDNRCEEKNVRGNSRPSTATSLRKTSETPMNPTPSGTPTSKHWWQKIMQRQPTMQWISYIMIFSVLLVFILEYPVGEFGVAVLRNRASPGGADGAQRPLVLVPRWKSSAAGSGFDPAWCLISSPIFWLWGLLR